MGFYLLTDKLTAQQKCNWTCSTRAAGKRASRCEREVMCSSIRWGKRPAVAKHDIYIYHGRGGGGLDIKCQLHGFLSHQI
jgi:hypothetical protein